MASQQAGVSTHFEVSAHQLKPVGQSQVPQLLDCGHSMGTAKQLLMESHHAKEGRKVRQLPHPSWVAQHSGTSTQVWKRVLSERAHQLWVGPQTQWPQLSWLLGHSAGMATQMPWSTQKLNPALKVRQLPQLSQVAQQSGILTHFRLFRHQVYPASQTHWPQSLWLFGHSSGISTQLLSAAQKL